MKDNEDNITPNGDVIMKIGQKNATLEADEVEDNLTSTATEAQNTSTDDVTTDDNLSSTLIQVVITTHGLPFLNFTPEAATNIQTTTRAVLVTTALLEAQDPRPAPDPALESITATEPELSLPRTPKRQHSYDTLQEGPNKRHSSIPFSSLNTSMQSIPVRHMPTMAQGQGMPIPCTPLPPLTTTRLATLLTSSAPPQYSTPAASVKNGVSKPNIPRVPSDNAEKIWKAKQKEKAVRSSCQEAAPTTAYEVRFKLPAPAMPPMPAMTQASHNSALRSDSGFGRDIARRMENRMESLTPQRHSEVYSPSKSVPPQSGPRTPIKPLPTSLLTPKTHLRSPQVAKSGTPKSGETMMVAADMGAPTARASTADQSPCPTPVKNTLILTITPQTHRRSLQSSMLQPPKSGGTMIPSADMGKSGHGSKEAKEMEPTVFPMLVTEPSFSSANIDETARKLLFRTSAQAKRTWKDGGFANMPIISNSNTSKKGTDNKGYDVPWTPKDQMMSLESECPGAPLKRRKKGFLPESDDEANLPEVTGEVPKFNRAVVLQVKSKVNKERLSVEKRAPNNRKRLPGQHKAKLPFKVSKPAESPSSAQDPIAEEPEPLSIKIRCTVNQANKPLKPIPSTCPSPPLRQETQLIDNLQSLGIIAHPTHICGFEVSIRDLYSIVNYKHNGYDNVEASDLWTLIAAILVTPLLGPNRDAAQEVRKLYCDVLLAVSPPHAAADGNAAQMGNAEVDDDMMDSDSGALHLVDGAEFGSFRQLIATLYKGASTDDDQAADADGEDEAKGNFLSKLGAHAIESMQEVSGCLVDLHLLWSIVREGGGFSKVESEEMWKAVADALIFPSGSEGACDVLRAVYERLLLPLDRGHEGNDDHIAELVQVKAETKPVEVKVPDTRFPKGSHQKLLDALSAYASTTGKVIDPNIDICGKSIQLMDASVVVRHKLDGIQNVVMNDLWNQAAKVLDSNRRKKREKNAPTKIRRFWEETLCNLDLTLAPSVQKVAAAQAVPVAVTGTAQSTLAPSSFRFTEAQVTRLEDVWAVNKTPSKAEKEALTAEVGVPYRSVYNWFMTRKGTRWQEQQQKKTKRAKQPVKPVIANNSNLNGDDNESLEESHPVPSALKQHRTKLNFPPKPQEPKTYHPKTPAKCEVSTCPQPSIASKLQRNEAATRFLASTAGDLLAIRENDGARTGEADEVADDAANKNREPVQKKWPVVMDNGVVYRIHQDKADQSQHNCGLESTATLKLPSRTWSEKMSVSQDSEPTDHVHDDSNSTPPTHKGEHMMSGALIEADDGNFVPEEDVAARNGALACHRRFGGGAPSVRSPPAHNRPRSRPLTSNGIPVVRASDDEAAAGPLNEKDGSNHDEVMVHLKGMSSRQIREEIHRQFGGYSWENNGNGGRHSPVGGVSPCTISLDDSFVQSAYRPFLGDGDGGDLPPIFSSSSSEIEMVNAAAHIPTQEEIATAIIETLPALAPAPSTATISGQEVDLDLLNMLVNDKYGGYANVEERNLWRHIAIGLRFGDVTAGSEVAEGLRRLYGERVMPAISQQLVAAIPSIVIQAFIENHRVSSNLNSLFADKKAEKSKKDVVVASLSFNVAKRSTAATKFGTEAKEAGTKDTPASIDLGFAIIEDAGGDKLLVRRDAIVVPDGIHPVIAEPLALEPKVLEKLSEPKKRPMDFVCSEGGKA